MPRRRGKATILAELSWVFAVGATDLAFAAGTTRITLLPGVSITRPDCFKTESSFGSLVSAAGHIGAHLIAIKLLNHCEARHALWKAITEGA
jgi:hypothetical protein